MGPMDTLRILAVAGVAALAGCAAGPNTTAMGAGPDCDLRVELRRESWCALRHVSPPDTDSQLTQAMKDFEDRTQPR